MLHSDIASRAANHAVSVHIFIASHALSETMSAVLGVLHLAHVPSDQRFHHQRGRKKVCLGLASESFSRVGGKMLSV